MPQRRSSARQCIRARLSVEPASPRHVLCSSTRIGASPDDREAVDGHVGSTICRRLCVEDLRPERLELGAHVSPQATPAPPAASGTSAFDLESRCHDAPAVGDDPRSSSSCCGRWRWRTFSTAPWIYNDKELLLLLLPPSPSSVSSNFDPSHGLWRSRGLMACVASFDYPREFYCWRTYWTNQFR